jgi:predicted PurR-regulated permease PerM
MKQSWDPAFRYFVLTIILIVIALALWSVRVALPPLVGAALAAYFLSPAVAFFHKRLGVSRKLAANLVFFLVLTLIIALPSTILPGELDTLGGIFNDLNLEMDKVQVVLQEPIRIGNIRIDLSSLIPALRANMGSAIVPRPEDALRVLEIGSRNLLWTLVVVVSIYFLMTDWDRLRAWLIGLAPPGEQPDLERLYEEIRRVWIGYLGGQIRLIVVLAILYAAAWALIGLPGAVIIGTLAGLLNLVPELGPATAALFAVGVALGVYLALNNFKTIWLQPRILGQSVRMHEGVVFLAIVISIMLGGALAVLVVVPVLATIGVVGRYLRHRLLGESPYPENVPAAVIPEPLPALSPEARPHPMDESVRKKP